MCKNALPTQDNLALRGCNTKCQKSGKDVETLEHLFLSEQSKLIRYASIFVYSPNVVAFNHFGNGGKIHKNS